MSLIGDSQIRHIYRYALKCAGVNTRGAWAKGSLFTTRSDFFLKGFDARDGRRRVWFSYAANWITFGEMHQPHHDKFPGREGKYLRPMPRTWGEWLEGLPPGSRPCKEGSCPDFPPDKAPDVVFVGPGYHAAPLEAPNFGAEVEEDLAAWGGLGRMPPRVHVVLNVMPAPWMMPERLSFLLLSTTLKRNHDKNLALIAAARKFDIVESVVDFSSLELPFNGMGPEEESAHKDVIHMKDERMFKLMGMAVMDRVCGCV